MIFKNHSTQPYHTFYLLCTMFACTNRVLGISLTIKGYLAFYGKSGHTFLLLLFYNLLFYNLLYFRKKEKTAAQRHSLFPTYTVGFTSFRKVPLIR